VAILGAVLLFPNEKEVWMSLPDMHANNTAQRMPNRFGREQCRKDLRKGVLTVGNQTSPAVVTISVQHEGSPMLDRIPDVVESSRPDYVGL
jgi:hypothetical protein